MVLSLKKSEKHWFSWFGQNNESECGGTERSLCLRLVLLQGAEADLGRGEEDEC